MNRKKAKKLLEELEDMATGACCHVTEEPMYYDIINRTSELHELLTPWYVKLWRKYKARMPIKDSEIPF